MKNDNPCFHCEDRVMGCHSTCQKYISWRAARDEELEKIHKIKTVEDMFCEGMRKRMRR